jgi:hypothetical protein
MPAPTATSRLIARGVEEVTAESALAQIYFLGLSTSDRINLGISVLLALLSYLAGTVLICRILPPIVKCTPPGLDDRLAEKLGPDLRWLSVVLSLWLATDRLTSVNARLKVVRIVSRCAKGARPSTSRPAKGAGCGRDRDALSDPGIASP